MFLKNYLFNMTNGALTISTFCELNYVYFHIKTEFGKIWQSKIAQHFFYFLNAPSELVGHVVDLLELQQSEWMNEWNVQLYLGIQLVNRQHAKFGKHGGNRHWDNASDDQD